MIVVEISDFVLSCQVELHEWKSLESRCWYLQEEELVHSK
jgi:hypothetical protein